MLANGLKLHRHSRPLVACLSSSGSVRRRTSVAAGKQVDAVPQHSIASTALLPPKGTRDFYPEEHRRKAWLHERWRETARSYGFEEYDAPVLESEELYVRKAGEEITEQLYNFIDKGGRRVSLRPEMTPSLARMVLAKGKSLALPLKWFSIPQCWRYERMTRGRRREHYQWNMDVWGVPGLEAEAELISSVVSCFRDLGLTSSDVGIKVNSRTLLNEVMTLSGIPPPLHAAVCVVVDKLDKLPTAALEQQLLNLGVSADAAALLLSRIQAKTLLELDAELGGASRGTAELRQLLRLLEEGYGIGADWVGFDFSVVRGLAYYTGVVFEGFDRAGKLRAICGGGRYDKLFEAMGGQRAIPAVGFGFGDAVVTELLADKGLLPDLSGGAAEVVVFALAEELRPKAMAVAAGMRARGLRVDLVLEQARKTKAVMQRAGRDGAEVIVIVAPDEHSAGTAVVRQLKKGEQAAQPYADIAEYVRGLLRDGDGKTPL